MFAAGEISDLEDLREWCAALPTDAYGQIFIEVFTPYQVQRLDAPERVGVTWIHREQRRAGTRSSVCVPRGQALADAVDAWLDEWIRADPGFLHFTLWMGAQSSSIMRSFWFRLEAELRVLWSHQLRS